MSAVIHSLGFSVPLGRIAQKEAANFATRTSRLDEQEGRRIHALYRRTGIDSRASVVIDPDSLNGESFQSFFPIARNEDDRGPSTQQRLNRFEQEAPPLAAAASTQAIERSGIEPKEFTHIIPVTCTGFFAPGVDIELINRLGLRSDTERIQIGFMGCHAGINALRAAKGLIAEDSSRRVLICCIELCSLHYQYGSDSNSIVSNALFADGASALVIGDGVNTNTNINERIQPILGDITKTASTLIPHTKKAMSWRIGNHGFRMTLSAEVPNLIETKLKPLINHWLQEEGLELGEVGGWAIHPGGTRILAAVQDTLLLSDQQMSYSYNVLQQHGNMSSATLPFILQQLAEASQPKPWVMLGFGPGLEVEFALIK